MSDLAARLSASPQILRVDARHGRRSAEATIRQHGRSTPVDRRSRPPVRAYASNPVRIERIGTDHMQVFIRSERGDAALLLGVERIERLFDAGFDTINVVVEASSQLASGPERLTDAEEVLEHAHRSAPSGNPTSGEDTR